MAVFAALGKSTEEGIRHLENLGARHRAAAQRVEKAGGKLLASYALLGHYDYLVILEFPDQERMIQFIAREAARGSVRYETLPAIPTEEFGRLLEG